MNTTSSLTGMTTATAQVEQTGPFGQIGQTGQALEEGTVYVVRKGKLERLPRHDEEGMRRLRVTEEAYRKAVEIGQQMRKDLGGYKPDVSLVVSALLLGDIEEERARERVRQFVLRMFSQPARQGEEG